MSGAQFSWFDLKIGFIWNFFLRNLSEVKLASNDKKFQKITVKTFLNLKNQRIFQQIWSTSFQAHTNPIFYPKLTLKIHTFLLICWKSICYPDILFSCSSTWALNSLEAWEEYRTKNPTTTTIKLYIFHNHHFLPKLFSNYKKENNKNGNGIEIIQ
jgi:hypothetical protein